MSRPARQPSSRQAPAIEVLNASPEAIAALDADLRVLLLNREAEHRLGRTLEEVAGRVVTDIVPEEMARELAARCREAIADQQPRKLERASDGRVHEFDIRPIEGGGAAIWFREITARKQLEETLRANDQKLRLLIENVKDYAMFAMDIQGRVISWNAGAERIFGYCEDEILGKPGLCIFTPEDRVNGVAEKEMTVALAEGRAEDERWHLKKDGSRFYASGILTPLWDEDGELCGFSKILRDFTERRKAEEMVLEAQKLESVGVLAGGIAHEFNNLLAVILGNTSLVMEDIGPRHPSYGFLAAVLKSSDRAHRLTSQMLAYSGKGGFWKQPMDVSSAISEMEDLLRAAVPKKTRLQFQLARKLRPVLADPTQVQQLVTNLVSNAGEAIGAENRGSVTIRTKAEVLDEAFVVRNFHNAIAAPGEFVSIEVQDTGAGMSDDVAARIFDPFFTTKFTGRGLGLAAVAGIVRSLGGGITLDTAPGKGSRFSVYLPVTAALENATTNRETAAPGSAAAAGTVLIVDDEPMVRDAASRMLRRRGFEVLAAGNGEDAIHLLASNREKVGVALLDLRMPDVSGHELLPRLREVRPDLRVIVASGYSEAQTRESFSGQTVTGYIQKPYSSAELVERIERAIASGE